MKFKHDNSLQTFQKHIHNAYNSPVLNIFHTIPTSKFKIHMNYVIEGNGALVNEQGEETPLKAGDFALVNPDEEHQYRNKGEVPFKMICGVP